jgi:hypothetical protein
MSEWETLGGVEPGKLIEARLQLHWAAQAVAAVGKQLLPKKPDFSQQSFRWMEGPRALAQGMVTVGAGRPFRSAIRLASPSLLLLDEEGEILRELPLEGRTLAEAYGWVKAEVEALLGRPLEQPLERTEGLPEHPVAGGAPFAFPNLAAPAELARYFADADRLLRGIEERNPGASPVRCWPHHFDLATLIALDPGADPEEARSIGVGLSPGDGDRSEPYLYVLPWPKPPREQPELPALDGGGWNTGDWVGAVMEAADFTGAGSNGAQRARMERFLSSAVAACRNLLGDGK